MNILRKLFDTIKTLSVWASADNMLTVHVEKQHVTHYNKFQQLLIDEKPIYNFKIYLNQSQNSKSN